MIDINVADRPAALPTAAVPIPTLSPTVAAGLRHAVGVDPADLDGSDRDVLAHGFDPSIHPIADPQPH